MRHAFLLLMLVGCALRGQAQTQARILLRLEPATKRFWCRYTMVLPADAGSSQVQLNLSKQFTILAVRSSRAKQQHIERYLYPVFQDTVQGITLSYAPNDQRSKQITITYEGTLTAKFATDQVMEFSRHSTWLPLLPYREDQPVDYQLEVHAPRSYSVVSTQLPTHHSPGQFRFRGRTAAIEPTIVVAERFQRLASSPKARPPVLISKAGSPLLRADTLLLSEAERIIAFYNKTIGRQDTIPRFSILLPGTNRSAFGLLDNATVVTYSDFDVRKLEDRTILAHEISHKWWAYGSINDYNEWLNEAFATYSSLLYLQATGDTAAFRQELNTRQKAAIGAPAIIGFNKATHDYPMFRRVIYAKGTAVLAALHTRVGDQKFIAILAASAAQKTATTEAFLGLVAQEAGEETRRWLANELMR